MRFIKRKIKLAIAIFPLVLFLAVCTMYLRFEESSTESITVSSEEKGMVYEGSISSEGKLMKAGEEIDVKFKIKNITGSNKEKIEVKIVADGSSKPLGKDTLVIETLGVNEESNIEWKIKCKSGGTRFIVQVKEKNKEAVDIKLGGVTVGGKGWFLGDNHTHSTYSDGKGSVAQNIWGMRSNGLNYMTLSDHGNSNGWEEGNNEKGSGEIIFKGNEYTTSSGHAVLMNINDNKNYNEVSKENMVKEINESTNGKGLIYVAHPYDPNFLWSEENIIHGINGIEVWNGDWGPKYKINKEAFELWDRLNKGGRHLYGVAQTDSHTPENIGRIYVKTLADEFNTESIAEGQRLGHMYGTNGPTIDMRANSSMMGDSLKVGSLGDIVKVSLSGEYYEGISKVRLIRNGEVIVEKEINNTSFDFVERVRVVPGDFIRMEVDGVEKDGKTLSTDSGNKNCAPFAFSNPIFMVKK